MSSRRTKRVAEALRQELGFILTTQTRDPRLKGVAISEVDVAPDLKRAYVYFFCAPGQEDKALEGLTQAAGFLRREAAARLSLRFMPELIYRHDDSLDRGRAMDDLLASLKDE